MASSPIIVGIGGGDQLVYRESERETVLSNASATNTGRAAKMALPSRMPHPEELSDDIKELLLHSFSFHYEFDL